MGFEFVILLGSGRLTGENEGLYKAREILTAGVGLPICVGGVVGFFDWVFILFSALMDGCDGSEGLRMSLDLDDDLEVVVPSDSDW